MSDETYTLDHKGLLEWLNILATSTYVRYASQPTDTDWQVAERKLHIDGRWCAVANICEGDPHYIEMTIADCYDGTPLELHTSSTTPPLWQGEETPDTSRMWSLMHALIDCGALSDIPDSDTALVAGDAVLWVNVDTTELRIEYPVMTVTKTTDPVVLGARPEPPPNLPTNETDHNDT